MQYYYRNKSRKDADKYFLCNSQKIIKMKCTWNYNWLTTVLTSLKIIKNLSNLVSDKNPKLRKQLIDKSIWWKNAYSWKTSKFDESVKSSRISSKKALALKKIVCCWNLAQRSLKVAWVTEKKPTVSRNGFGPFLGHFSMTSIFSTNPC